MTFVDVCVLDWESYNIDIFQKPNTVACVLLTDVVVGQSMVLERGGSFCCYSVLLALDIANTEFKKKKGLWL